MPNHVYVVARFFARPEKVSELAALAAGLLAPTRAEPGCVRYDLWRNDADPLEFAMIEEWRSAADLDRHLGLPHLEHAKARLPEFLAKPLEITRFSLVG
jgi:quinol monooxygenase YgiN